jgi:hypothetical protein
MATSSFGWAADYAEGLPEPRRREPGLHQRTGSHGPLKWRHAWSGQLAERGMRVDVHPFVRRGLNRFCDKHAKIT